jgi:hypothetical protein
MAANWTAAGQPTAGQDGGAVAVLLGIAAFVAYSLGHQSAPISYQPVALARVPPLSAKPVVFNAPAVQAPPVVTAPPSATTR